MNLLQILKNKKIIAAILLTSLVLLAVTSCSEEKNKENQEDPPAEGTAVYHRGYYSSDAVYYGVNARQTIATTPTAYPGEAYYICTDPLCNHNDYFCPVYSVCFTAKLVVEREGSTPLIYTFGKPNPDVYVDGEYRPLKGDEAFNTEVRVFDTATGESKRIAQTTLYNVREAWLYRGVLYMWADTCKGGGASVRVGMVDTDTGEFSYIKAATNMKMIGISNDRVYYITDRGMIGSCALDLSDMRDEYNVGPEPTRDQFRMPDAYIDSGVIYFERNCRIPEDAKADVNANLYAVADVYALDSSDIDAGERLVAEGVLELKPCGGDLYYTKMAYKQFDKVSIDGNPEHDFIARTLDGGTMYFYDHKSGESRALFSDIGTSFEEIFDVTEDKIIFQGLRYRDFESCKNWDGRDYICVCDVKTGKWEVLYHANDFKTYPPESVR